MLTAIIIVTIVGGAVLGLRYKEVFILAPAFLFPLLAVIGAGVARGAGIWPIALEMERERERDGALIIRTNAVVLRCWRRRSLRCFLPQRGGASQSRELARRLCPAVRPCCKAFVPAAS
jgi:hypothetical protein